MIDIIILKIIILVSLFFTSILAGLSPMILRKIGKCFEKTSGFIEKFLKFSQGLAAGVLLGGGMLHLIPDATEDISEILEEWNAPDWVIDFPIAMTVAGSSLMLIFTFETLIKVVFGEKKKKTEKEKEKKQEKNPLLGEDVTTEESIEEDIRKRDMETNQEEVKEQEHAHEHEHTHHHHHHVNMEFFAEKNLFQKVVGAIFLFFSLALHSFFVGLALGAEKEVNKFFIILMAVLAHKFVAAYSLGIELETSIKSKVLVILFILIFSFSVPGGMIIGMVFSVISENLIFTFISAVCVALGSGAFLHVALFEFVFEFASEVKKTTHFLLYITLFVIGFAIMAVLSIWA